MSKSPDFITRLKKWGAEAIIDKLSPYLTEERKKRILPIVDHRIQSIQIAVEDPSDIHNALAIVRTSEALGLTDAHLIGEPSKGRGRQTMRGSDRWINLHSHISLENYKQLMEENHLVIFGATPHGKVPLEEIPLDQPCCFLFGNEKQGLTKEALDICKIHYTIPMYGFCESFNLSVAAAITLHHAVKQKRELLASNGDLSNAEKMIEIAWFYYKSTGSRLANQIID